jgi:hypothetical protein
VSPGPAARAWSRMRPPARGSERSPTAFSARHVPRECSAPLAGADYPWVDSDIRHLNARLVDLLRRTGQARLAHGDPHGAQAFASASPTSSLSARIVLLRPGEAEARGATPRRDMEQSGWIRMLP